MPAALECRCGCGARRTAPRPWHRGSGSRWPSLRHVADDPAHSEWGRGAAAERHRSRDDTRARSAQATLPSARVVATQKAAEPERGVALARLSLSRRHVLGPLGALMRLVNRLAAEFIGHVLAGPGCLWQRSAGRQVPRRRDRTLLGVALPFGLTVLTMAYALGHISGGHFNAAVTIGLLLGRRFEAREALPYIVAQPVRGEPAARGDGRPGPEGADSLPHPATTDGCWRSPTP